MLKNCEDDVRQGSDKEEAEVHRLILNIIFASNRLRCSKSFNFDIFQMLIFD